MKRRRAKKRKEIRKVDDVMKMDDAMKRFETIGVIPVVVLESADDAEGVADALCDGGLPCAEVTFRTDCAAEVIARMSRQRPDMFVGAGTVLTPEQVNEAVQAGAQFIVSPGTNMEVVRRCQEIGVPVVPGVQTPTEIEAGIRAGLPVLKFFPAEASGGLKMIKALAGPYRSVRFMPTGGIKLSNLRDYLEYDRILACGGSWIVTGELVKAKDYGAVRENAAAAASIVRELRGSGTIHH